MIPTYGRNAKIQDESLSPASGAKAHPNEEKGGMRINGFQQVLDLLRAADPEFRESLLRRMQKHDPQLVDSLRRSLY
ncbi:MAG: hypothetical protein CL678_08885 [Bdellovibrionaceae bacterium]|nr:hypothetical protein [Pseudobdellovibrionaceae bacterium]|tara:strand:+ start:1702 stop:1932 length:231 start_codon:yes stop_codon:yes gene_type:complete